jgi:hypothetical protein
MTWSPRKRAKHREAHRASLTYVEAARFMLLQAAKELDRSGPDDVQKHSLGCTGRLIYTIRCFAETLSILDRAIKEDLEYIPAEPPE